MLLRRLLGHIVVWCVGSYCCVMLYVIIVYVGSYRCMVWDAIAA